MSRRHAEETKARGLLSGQRPAVVTHDPGIPEGPVRGWRHRHKAGGVATLKKGSSENGCATA